MMTLSIIRSFFKIFPEIELSLVRLHIAKKASFEFILRLLNEIAQILCNLWALLRNLLDVAHS